jgi:hypothetical protein
MRVTIPLTIDIGSHLLDTVLISLYNSKGILVNHFHLDQSSPGIFSLPEIMGNSGDYIIISENVISHKIVGTNG